MDTVKLALCALLLNACAATALAEDNENSLEEQLKALGNTPIVQPSEQDTAITSVGKKRQRLADAAAAISTITQDEIRRSGVTSIADALRLVPGMQVARIDSNKWAVTARGFNGALANKLLVLMDGREVYNPVFSGVHWDVQDLPLEDIDRIEVIRGPGATLWGANAVNGVVNIITKHSRETLGGSLRAGGGSYEQGFGSLRYGLKLGEQAYGRIYAKGVNRSRFSATNGQDAQDQWAREQVGFRIDLDNFSASRFTLLGGAYHADLSQILSLPRTTPPYNVTTLDKPSSSGFNLLGRWSKALSLSSEFTLQTYYDHFSRRQGYVGEERDIFDVDFQHRWRFGQAHDITWGLGYRLIMDRSLDVGVGSLRPAAANNQLASGFLQDDISLIDNLLVLTLGTKLQRNDYSGFEWSPSARLAWTPNERHTTWGAISRAVRTPNRTICCGGIRYSTIPPFSATNPSPLPVVIRGQGVSNPASEPVMAYEMGYRYHPSHRFAFDLAFFYNDYTSLYSADPAYIRVTPDGFPPRFLDAAFPFTNNTKAQSFGTELQVDWNPLDWWQLQLTYSYIDLHLFALSSGSNLFSVPPKHQASLFSRVDLKENVDFDFWLRYVDSFPVGFGGNPGDRIPDYVTVDARLAWRPRKDVELSVIGQNLLQGRHQEFYAETWNVVSTTVPRSYYLQLNWQF